MSLAQVLRLAVLALITATVACGTPPDKEIQQAQGAIDAARVVGADRYAVEEFTAAQDAQKRAHEAVAQRDYRLALSNALDARERAQNAAKQAADGKAAARVDADRALSAASNALTGARAALKTAEASRSAGKALSAARVAIASAARRLQEARAAFDRTDYADAVSAALAVTTELKAASTDLAAASNPASRRRR